MSPEDDKVYTVAELATALKVSEDAAYCLVRSPGFPHFRIGKSIRIPARALDQWLMRQAGEHYDTVPMPLENRARLAGRN